MISHVYNTPGLRDDIESDDCLDVIVGPKDDNYIILGKVLFNSGNIYLEFEDTYQEIDIGMLTHQRLDATASMAKHLPEYVHYMNGEWKIMTFLYPA